MTTPKPGDFGVVKTGGRVGWWIRFGELLLDGHDAYTHAFLVVDGGLIVEAQPGGAVIRSLGEWPDAVYSTGIIPLTDAQRTAIVEAAHTLVGTPYGWLDYASLILLRLHIRPGLVKRRVNDGTHLICSQLVDRAWNLAGVHLYDDGRPEGDVTPADLGALIGHG